MTAEYLIVVVYDVIRNNGWPSSMMNKKMYSKDLVYEMAGFLESDNIYVSSMGTCEGYVLVLCTCTYPMTTS